MKRGEVPIGDGVSELAAAQIDAADRIALSAVADGAASRVEARAVRDIDVGILAIVELGCLLRRHRHRADRRHDDHHDCEVNHFLHSSSPWHEREKTARVVDGDLADHSARNCHWTFSVARSLRASQYSPAQRDGMSRTAAAALALVVGLVAGIPLGGRLMSSAATPAATAPGTEFSAVPDAIGAQDVSGPVRSRRRMAAGSRSTLPGHEQWTYGGARGIFAESPNRVFLLGGGELPKIARPQTRLFPEIGPNVQFPLAGLPWRNANTASPPGAGGSGQDPGEGAGDLARRVSAVPQAWSRLALGALGGGRQRRRTGHQGVDAVGQAVQASARGVHQSL